MSEIATPIDQELALLDTQIRSNPHPPDEMSLRVALLLCRVLRDSAQKAVPSSPPTAEHRLMVYRASFIQALATTGMNPAKTPAQDYAMTVETLARQMLAVEMSANVMQVPQTSQAPQHAPPWPYQAAPAHNPQQPAWPPQVPPATPAGPPAWPPQTATPWNAPPPPAPPGPQAPPPWSPSLQAPPPIPQPPPPAPPPPAPQPPPFQDCGCPPNGFGGRTHINGCHNGPKSPAPPPAPPAPPPST